MVLLSEVLGIVVSLIIFVFLITFFFSVFGAPECDRFANSTAEELRAKINKVALEDEIAPYNKDGVPPDSAENQYVVVPIKLCEKAEKSTFKFEIPFIGQIGPDVTLTGVGASLAAQTPTYILVYEKFPEGAFGWSETQPWGGGSMSALIFYGMLKSLKYIKKAGKMGKNIVELSGKFVSRIVKGTKSFLTSIFDGTLLKKISYWWRKFKDNRIIRKILHRNQASNTITSVRRTLPERYLDFLYPDEHKNTIGMINRAKNYWNLNEIEAFAEIGIIESKFDRQSGKWVPILGEVVTPKGLGAQKATRLLVKPEYADFMKKFIDLTDNKKLKDLYKEIYYIPSKYSWLEKIKTEKWYPFRYKISNWWNSNWFKRNIIDKSKNTYDEIKEGWNKHFNTKNYLGPYDTPQKAGSYKKWAYLNFDEFKDKIKNNFDDFKGVLNDVSERSIRDVNDLSDEDILKFISVYDKHYNAVPYAQFAVRGEAVVSHSFETMGSIIKEEAEKVAKDPSKFNAFRNKFGKSWNAMTIGEQNEWIRRLMDGHGDPRFLKTGQAKTIWEDLQAHLAKEGLLDNTKVFSAGELRKSFFVKKADKIKGEMFSGILRRAEFRDLDEFEDAIPNFYLRKVVEPSPTAFEKLKPVIGRANRIMFLDLGRIGQGPMAPWNPIGPMAARESVEKSTEIVEGGCQQNSICSVVRGKPTAYLLDSEVPKQTEVKLWREKPGLDARLPFGLSTGMLYPSVAENPRFYVASPCFAMAKIWKNGDTVYVHIDKSKKCDVAGCPSGVNTPNYCYASEEYIWGEDLSKWGDQPEEWKYFAELGVCTVACAAISQGGAWYQCLQGCSYATIATLFGVTILETQDYRNLPSWERQETGWGYWNYQKAEDLCDLIEIIADIGGWRAGKSAVTGGKLQKLSGWLNKHKRIKRVAGGVAGVGKRIKGNVDDLCSALTLIGDTSLAWPIKVPVGEIWKKGTPLDVDCMEESAPYCAWLERCESSDDCEDLGRPGIDVYECVNSVCQKTCTDDSECPSYSSCEGIGGGIKICIRQIK